MKRSLLSLIAASFLVCGAQADTRTVQVVRVLDVPKTEYRALSELADFWGIDRPRKAVIMAVSPEQRQTIEALGYEVQTDEQRMRSLEYAESVDARGWREAGMQGIPGFPCYRSVDETKADLLAMASTRPDLAQWTSIGQSWRQSAGQTGGDDLYALVLGNRNSPHERSPLVIMSAQHARELTTAETASRFAEWLFTRYDTDATARWLLDHRDIHIIAQQNPDGRREVENGVPMWRKNSNLDACPGASWTGVDLNRNSDYFWGDFSQGASCEQTYRGTSESSEPETQAVQDYLALVFERHRPGSPDNVPTDPVAEDADGLFISLHSFSELILFPWEGAGSGPSNNAPNHDQLAWLGRKFGYFTGYGVGRDLLYSAGGTMTDFAHGEFGVAAYTFEIGTDFQESCGNFEETIWNDLLDALIYAAKAAERPYQAPSGPDVIEASAVYNAQTGRIRLQGIADDARFDRGGAGEAPANDPISEPVQLEASFDVPPHLASEVFTIDLAGGGPISTFDAEIDLQQSIALPRLLFLRATDSAGDTGVPEAVWLVEQRAAVSPSGFSMVLATGASAERTLTIDNIGSSGLSWSVATDQVAQHRGTADPTLTEALSLPNFSIAGGATHQALADAGLDSRGQVVGFSFEGTVSGLDGNSTWASDLALTITSPQGASYAVGGFSTGHPPWDFDGDISASDGTYSSEHLGDDIFGADGTADLGQWRFDFEHTYNDAMNWSGVTVSLLKQALPECADPAGVPWITLQETSGTLAPGERAEIRLTVDAGGLSEGQHRALLCVATDDPAAELIAIDVSLEVTGVIQTIFQDSFENLLR